MAGKAKSKTIFHRGKRSRTGSLKGWWKAMPFIALPFSVMFSEAWLQTQVLTLQYQANELTQEIRDVEGSVDSLQDKRHNLVRIDRINAKAPDLGLGVPNPGQIEAILDPEGPALLETEASAIATVIDLPKGMPDIRSARWNTSATLSAATHANSTVRSRRTKRGGSVRAKRSFARSTGEGAPLENLFE